MKILWINKINPEFKSKEVFMNKIESEIRILSKLDY